jgi:hypothetical protein
MNRIKRLAKLRLKTRTILEQQGYVKLKTRNPFRLTAQDYAKAMRALASVGVR